jgi:hypothetical protein
MNRTIARQVKTNRFLRAGFVTCFAVLILCTLVLALWVMVALAVSDQPAPTAANLRLVMLFIQIGALALYFKYPHVVAVVGWINLILALTKTFPWSEPGVANFFYQFSFDLLFLCAANAGLALWMAQRHVRNSSAV